MTNGVHAMFYAPNAEELRAFIRDKLSLPFSDVGNGWLVFDVEGEVGCHPAEKSFHGISFYCDDLEATVAELKGKGVEFTADISDAGFGSLRNLNCQAALKWSSTSRSTSRIRRAKQAPLTGVPSHRRV